MGGYRSDLEAARAHIEKLEASIDRVEEERARLASELAARPRPTASPVPWVAAAVASVVAVVALGAALADADPPDPPPRVAATIAPAPEPAAEPAPEAFHDPTLAAVSPDPNGLEESNRDTAFFGQYWEARVAEPGTSGLERGARCLITTDPGLHNGAGVARVECGDTILHRTAVTPPWRENDGFCHFRDGELLCAPVRGSSHPGCWVSTPARQARCEDGLELEIHTLMRDPRRRPPPLL